MARHPGSVLFVCNHNSVRSPMAEALMKRLFNRRIFTQSASAKKPLPVHSAAIRVMAEIGLDLSRHRSRSLEDMKDWGEDVESFDMIIALSPAAQRRALDLTSLAAVEVEYWPTFDPDATENDLMAQMTGFRSIREQIHQKIIQRFAPERGFGG